MTFAEERLQAILCNPWCYDPARYDIPKVDLYARVLRLMKKLNRRQSDWDKENSWSKNELALIRNAIEEKLNNEQIIQRFRLSGNKKHYKLIEKKVMGIRRQIVIAKSRRVA